MVVFWDSGGLNEEGLAETRYTAFRGAVYLCSLCRLCMGVRGTREAVPVCLGIREEEG